MNTATKCLTVAGTLYQATKKVIPIPVPWGKELILLQNFCCLCKYLNRDNWRAVTRDCIALFSFLGALSPFPVAHVGRISQHITDTTCTPNLIGLFRCSFPFFHHPTVLLIMSRDLHCI